MTKPVATAGSSALVPVSNDVEEEESDDESGEGSDLDD